MTYSAQTDRFVHERLPPASQWPELRYELPELQLAPQLNLVEELLDKAVHKGFADRPLLRSPKLMLSYADVKDRVDRIAQVLVEDLGLVPGNRVLLRGGNSIGMALAWLAVVKAGLIAVATMPLLRAKELGDIIDKAQSAVALCDAKLLDELQLAQTQNPVLKTIVPFNLMSEPGSLAVLAAHNVVDFWRNLDAMNQTRIDLDHFLYDVVGVEHGVKLSTAQMDAISDQALALAKARGING